jgi:hypothetical protein
MPKTQRQTELKDQLDKSRGVQMLLPSYRQALVDLANNHESAQQSAVSMILKREKNSDLQSVYFTENVLQQFIEKNYPPQDQEQLLEEYKEKTRHLIRTFLFLSTEEKDKLIPQLDSLNIEGLKEMIELYHMGHHKQNEYLQVFAEKDPKSAIKFEMLVDGKTLPEKQKTKK